MNGGNEAVEAINIVGSGKGRERRPPGIEVEVLLKR